jgi:hypothetical protein
MEIIGFAKLPDDFTDLGYKSEVVTEEEIEADVNDDAQS